MGGRDEDDDELLALLGIDPDEKPISDREMLDRIAEIITEKSRKKKHGGRARNDTTPAIRIRSDAGHNPSRRR